MTTVQTTTDIRQNHRRAKRARRQARRATRVIAGNFRGEAKRQGIGVFELRSKARVTPWRMLGLWTGQRLMMNDLFRVQDALGMSVADVFAGDTAVSA